jgi:putative endonuclease
MNARRDRGLCAHYAGLAAEDCVARDYARRGAGIAHRRWRGRSGEIDLVARDGAAVVFVEVKKARSFEAAALRLGARQIARLCSAAAEFLGGEPAGQLTECRFDLALVDGQGGVRIVENAFGTA